MGIGGTSEGTLGIGGGTFEHQTLLARAISRPRLPSTTGDTAMVTALICGALAFLVTAFNIMPGKPVNFAAILSGIVFIALSGASVVALVIENNRWRERHRAEMVTYHMDVLRWNASFLCRRCGEVFEFKEN